MFVRIIRYLMDIEFSDKRTEKSDNIILIDEISGQEIPETR